MEPDIQEIVPHKVFRVSGSISLFDLNEEMHLHIDSTCDTLSGYLMEILGYIPDQENCPFWWRRRRRILRWNPWMTG